MAKMIKKYHFNQCVFYKLKSKSKLAKYLNLEVSQLKQIEAMIKYRTFNHKQEGKKDRLITAPNDDLKRVQKRVLQLLSRLERPSWLISGERGKSYIDNAKMHQKSKYVLTIDIRSFYGNTIREYVYLFWRDKMMMSNDTAEILTNILTYNGTIPTGSPASQLTAYYAYQNIMRFKLLLMKDMDAYLPYM